MRSQTDFVDITLTDVLEPIELSYLSLLPRVHLEVLVCNYDLLVEVINFLLLLGSHLLHHVVTRYEDCLEVVCIRKRGSLAPDFAQEIRLSIFTWDILESLQSLSCLSGL